MSMEQRYRMERRKQRMREGHTFHTAWNLEDYVLLAWADGFRLLGARR